MNLFDEYIKDVLSENGNRPVSELEKLCVKRYLSDLDKNWRWHFDQSKAERVIRYIQMMPHVKGLWAAQGQKIVLEPWQKFLVGNMFGWVDDNGLRRFKECYARVARKNGKSTLVAPIGNYLAFADGEHAAEVYSGATERNQALEVFKPAYLMIDKLESYRLKKGIRMMGSPEKPGSMHAPDGSFFTTVKGKPGDGPSPHGAIIDEYHEHPDSSMYDTFKSGMGSRPNGMILIITTAGTRTDGPCYEKDKECQALLRGELKDDRLFTMLFGMDKGDDPFSITSLKKANPNYGISATEDYLKMQMYNAKIKGGRVQTVYKIKHLNEWTNAKDAWMNMAKWDECSTDYDLIVDKMKEFPVYVGLDLASKIDITAMQFLCYDPDEDCFYTFGRYYLPQGAIDRCHSSVKNIYETLTQDGKIQVTPGERTDYNYIRNDLFEYASMFHIKQIAYDNWGAEIIYNELCEDGFKDQLILFAQTTRNRSDPMKEIEARVLDSSIKHPNDEALNWMIGNVVAKLDTNDNIVPNKESNERKIDAVDAMVMAMGVALNDIAELGEGDEYEDGIYFI